MTTDKWQLHYISESYFENMIVTFDQLMKCDAFKDHILTNRI